jgi:hypothetical protein
MKTCLRIALLASALSCLQVPHFSFAVCPDDTLVFARHDFLADSRPRAITTGDFNSDGRADLAVANNEAGNVYVLLNQGDQTFGLRSIMVFSSGTPTALATGDFNGDGYDDIVVGGEIANPGLLVSLGRGDGTFQSLAPFGNPGASDIAAADFDSDNILDLAVAYSNGTTIFKGQGSAGIGNGTFATMASYAGGKRVVVDDFNQDGIKDLATISSSSIFVLLGGGTGGIGDGTFADRRSVSFVTTGLCVDITAGDFNADGVPDLVGGGFEGGTPASDVLIVFLGNQDWDSGRTGLIRSTVLQTKYNPHDSFSYDVTCIAAGDFSGDGIPDLATGLQISTLYLNLLVFPGRGSAGRGDGSFGSPMGFVVAGQATDMVVRDFDENGTEDLAVATSYASSVDYNRISVMYSGCGPDTLGPPHLALVRDVPGDQGGWVSIGWQASGLDVAGSSLISGYKVWRRLSAGAAALSCLPLSDDGSPLFSPIQSAIRVHRASGVTSYWEPVGLVAAAHLEGYGFTAPTTQDSLAGSNPYTAFFVSALTGNPFVFFDSNADSGYSVDNLAPAAPAPFAGTWVSGSGTFINWGANAESDLAGYRLYRGDIPGFTPSPASLVYQGSQTSFHDLTLDPSIFKLCAYDVHGNQSAFATLIPDGTVGMPDSRLPVEFALRRVAPNPTRGPAIIGFALPREARVRIEIFDARGRCVRSLVDDTRPAGEWTVAWDGCDDAGVGVGAGLYLLRFRAEGRMFTQRLVRVD